MKAIVVKGGVFRLYLPSVGCTRLPADGEGNEGFFLSEKTSRGVLSEFVFGERRKSDFCPSLFVVSARSRNEKGCSEPSTSELLSSLGSLSLTWVSSILYSAHQI